MIIYKKDILEMLLNAGYSSYRIRKENVFPQSTLSKLRQGKMINLTTLDKICTILQCQPGELISWTNAEGQDD